MSEQRDERSRLPHAVWFADLWNLAEMFPESTAITINERGQWELLNRNGNTVAYRGDDDLWEDGKPER